MDERERARDDGRRLGEALKGDTSLLELQAQRRLGETIRDVERRLLAEARRADEDLRST